MNNSVGIKQYAHDNGLNGELAEAQGLTPMGIDLLVALHMEKDTLLKIADDLDVCIPDHLDSLRGLVKEMEVIEYAMQDAWGWEQSSSHHTHWMSFPQCMCPKMDNRDWMYSGRKIITSACPLHWKTDK